MLFEDTESNLGSCKLCPECSTTVNNKKNTCECGYVFHKYKKGGCVEGRRQSARIALKRKVESEPETTYRKEQYKLYVARKQSLESPQEASYRKEQNKLCMTRKQCLESPQKASYYRKSI